MQLARKRSRTLPCHLVHFKGIVRNQTTSIFFRLLRADSVINAWRNKKFEDEKKNSKNEKTLNLNSYFQNK